MPSAQLCGDKLPAVVARQQLSRTETKVDVDGPYLGDFKINAAAYYKVHNYMNVYLGADVSNSMNITITHILNIRSDTFYSLIPKPVI